MFANSNVKNCKPNGFLGRLSGFLAVFRILLTTVLFSSENWSFGGQKKAEGVVCLHFRPKKRPMRMERSRNSGGIFSVFSVQNEVYEFFQQVSWSGIWVVYALTFSVGDSDLVNDLHCFPSIERISGSYEVFSNKRR